MNKPVDLIMRVNLNLAWGFVALAAIGARGKERRHQRDIVSVHSGRSGPVPVLHAREPT